jgi:hypothetical protein
MNEQEEEETWIPSNAAIQRTLMWIGESRREQLIVDVGLACGLQAVVDM